MNNERFDELLAEYIDGVLPPAQRAEVEGLLSQDPELAAQVEDIRRLHPMLRVLPDVAAPPDMTDAILQATTRRRRFFLKGKMHRMPNLFRPVPAMAAIFVAIVVSVALFGYLRLADPLLSTESTTIAANDLPAPHLNLASADKDDRQPDVREAIAGLDGLAGGGMAGLRPVKTTGSAGRAAEISQPIGGASRAAKSMPRKAAPRFRRGDPDLNIQLVAFGKYGGERDRAEFEDRSVASQSPAADMRRKAKRAPAAPPSSSGAEPVERNQPAAAEEKLAEETGAAGEPAGAIRHRWDGYHSGITKRGAVIVSDQAAWAKLWAVMNANRVPAPDAPEFDFKENAAIAVFMGLHSTGGFGVQILSVRCSGDKIEVIVHERTPTPGQLVPQALTQPFSTVIVPRTIDGLTVDNKTPIVVLRR
jgi:PrcB C-terminal